jgi:hypothetical protein
MPIRVVVMVIVCLIAKFELDRGAISMLSFLCKADFAQNDAISVTAGYGIAVFLVSIASTTRILESRGGEGKV